MKKIMFFRPLYSLGGTEIAILNLSKKLSEEGYNIFIGYSDTTSDKHLLNRFKEYAEIININEVKNFEIDTFITCSAHYSLVKLENNIKAKKTILWLHCLINIEKSILTNDKEIEKLNSIITVSNTTKLILKKIFPIIANKITTIYNVIDEKEIKKLSNKKIELPLSNELNLVTVSRVCKEKGFERMLHLVKELKNKNVNFKWFIIGGNYYKEEFERIHILYEEFKENFVWFGFLDNPHNIVKQCDYSVLLSDDETWGLVLTEAMIVGTPCISADFPVAFEQIKDKKNGIILSNTNTTTYKDRINDIIENKEKYKKAVSKYSYKSEKIIKKWNDLLNEK